MKKSKLVFAGMILALSFIGCKATTDGGGEQPPVFVQYEFHDSVTTLTGEDKNGSYGTEGDYVLFGDFPQDVVPENKVDWLGLEKSTTKLERGYMEFVQGLDGNYYVKCAENAYEDSYKYIDRSTVKQQGKTSRWFKVMPIKWRVVDTEYDVDGDAGNKTAKLLVAENILTANVSYCLNYNNLRTIDSDTVYPNNYRYSLIRAYLNGLTYIAYDAKNDKNVDVKDWNGKGFLQTAFSQNAKVFIKDTEVDNTKEQMSYDGSTGMNEDYACGNTTDKIFLLSAKEVVNTSYGFEAYDSDDTKRKRMTTDFAKANYASQSETSGNGGFWWLRSPYDKILPVNAYCACNVDSYGGGGSFSVREPKFGVVPALCIEF